MKSSVRNRTATKRFAAIGPERRAELEAVGEVSCEQTQMSPIRFAAETIVKSLR